MYVEEIVCKINNLIKEIEHDHNTSLDTAKTAIHGLTEVNNLLIDGYSYEYYIKEGKLKPLNKISHF